MNGSDSFPDEFPDFQLVAPRLFGMFLQANTERLGREVIYGLNHFAVICEEEIKKRRAKRLTRSIFQFASKRTTRLETGSMFHQAMLILIVCWKRGAELRSIYEETSHDPGFHEYLRTILTQLQVK